MNDKYNIFEARFNSLCELVKPFGITVDMTIVNSEDILTLTADLDVCPLEWWSTYFHSLYEYVTAILLTVGFVAKDQIQADPATVIVNLGSVFDILKSDHAISS